MAAPRSQMAKTLCGINVASPKTPSNTVLTEAVPLHITPLDSIDSERDPDTPHKEPTSTYKKKSGKLVSKRKLFLQSGQNLHTNKAKRHASPKTPNAPTPASRPADGPRPHFPLTERQQLQYLLEVTAKEAKDSGSASSSNDDLPVNTCTNKAAKKDTSKDLNHLDARIRKRNERGETALHVAAIRGDVEDLVALIKAGALVNAKDNAGWTPLHEACNYGNLSIVQELVWSGADVNSPGYEAITPLHDAVINDHVKVVKFLLENGADLKLQTSQNYSASDLARSEAVLSLVSPEEQTTRDCHPINSQEFLAHPQYSDPSFNLPGIKINGFNSSFLQRSSYDDSLDQVEGTKTSLPHGYSLNFQGARDVEMHIIPKENFGVSTSNHINDKQDSFEQNFPQVYGFPGNAHHFTNEADVSKETEAINAKLSSKEAVENYDKEKRDNTALHFQKSPCYGVGSVELQLNGNAEVVKKINKSAASEEVVQNVVKDSFSATTCPNNLEGPVAEDLGTQINVKNIPAKKPGLTVTSESEEDTVIPEKLNECLDKAMIEISSYLETSQKVDLQVPCDERDLNKCDADLLKNDATLIAKSSSSESVNVNLPLRPEPIENSLNLDEQQPSVSSSLPNRLECKEDATNVFAEEVNTDSTNSIEQQPLMNFTKIKPRNEKKKDSGMSERSGKSSRRKRSSTRSSDISKCESNQSLIKEECTSHIANRSWRLDLPKYRYSLLATPLCVPGYEDFLINSKNSKSGSKSLSNEIIKDPAAEENQLERLISQHDTEKVKLRMSLEQELVRLFGNCARKSAGYQVPYSACTVISSQMTAPGMKQLRTEKEQPVSIKLEVDKILSKFNRLKTEMLKRHNREIEVVFALEHFWTQSEDSAEASRLPTRTWKDFSEDFELLPPKFNDYYEEVLCATD